ncbi:MAG: NADH-quinone oxidoreductase subunit J [Bacteroides sp.]|nr:NADH-quinone oxidoreductase subunit J [Bacteroides sp.]
MGETLETVVFLVLSVFIAVFSVMTVTTKRIVRSATYLLFVLFATAGFYFLLGYTFLGSVQIMVYAGGIVVLYVFSILLTSGENDYAEKLKRSRFFAGLLASIAGAAVVLFITLKHKFLTTTNIEPVEVNMKIIGHALLSGDKYGYIVPFEAISILLLACIIGGLLIARKR